MTIKDEEFIKLEHNVRLIGDKSVFDVYPELKKFPEFMVDLSYQDHEQMEVVDRQEKRGRPSKPTPKAMAYDKDKIMKYIMCLYQKGTPFMGVEKNLVKRKVLCALEAGFQYDKTTKLFHSSVDDMFKLKNDVINRMIIRYIRNQRDMQFALMMAGMENLYNMMERLSDPNITEENKGKVSYQAVEALMGQIQSTADQVFNEDVELIYTADVVVQEEEGKITSYPEYMARKRMR